MKKKREVNLRETLCPNGKYYVKLNGEYIGTYILKKSCVWLKTKSTIGQVMENL